MTEISPLGTIAIAILVARWNDSKDKERKDLIRKLLSSGDTLQARQAKDYIVALSDGQLHDCRFIWSGTVPIITMHLLTAIGTAMMATLNDGNRISETSDLYSNALEEATLYFGEAIKSGHFLRLPMPQFWHEPKHAPKKRARIPKKL